jgi:rod shape-determining protein MreC
MSTQSSPEPILVERILKSIVAPIQSVTHSVAGNFRMTWNNYVFLTQVQRENEELKEKIAQLTHQNNELIVLEYEVADLLKMLNYKGSFERQAKRKVIMAKVISIDFSPQYRVIRLKIKASSNEEIQENMPVITYEGVVGRIYKVMGNFADVLLLSDSKSKVHARVLENNLLGTVEGKSDQQSYRCQFAYFDPFYKFEPGYRLVTSGYDHIYPPGLLIGYLTDRSPKQTGKGYKTEVVPSVNISTLKTVFIITQSELSDQAQNIEMKGE